jgi:hypothetical protein
MHKGRPYISAGGRIYCYLCYCDLRNVINNQQVDLLPDEKQEWPYFEPENKIAIQNTLIAQRQNRKGRAGKGKNRGAQAKAIPAAL